MKISFFNVPFSQVIIRFYLMMLSVIVPFFIGVPALAILALPLFLSAMVGIKVEFKGKKEGIQKAIQPKNAQPQKQRA